MVRPRRTATPSTPYDRPRLVDSEEQNPNWISKLVFSPTRMIASSAGKLMSSVFGSDSDSSSSSSSISGSASSDEMDNNEDGKYVSSQGDEGFEKREPQSIVGTGETKRLIEQLLLRETFSREECDRLTSIIKSRVVDSSLIGFMETGRPNDTPNSTADNVVDTAVMEARKWLEEKKSGSSPKSDLHCGTCALNCAVVPLGSGGEAGSPVDLAKSYMRSRPPWASPSANHIEYRSPSPIQIHVCKEGFPCSISEKSLSSSKLKRESPTTSSWNIQDELRKVRSKATEEMLRTSRSSKINLLEYNSTHDSTVSERLRGVRDNDSSTKSLYASLNSAAETERTQDVFLNDALPNPNLSSEQNEGAEALQGIGKTGDDTLGTGHTLKSPEGIKNVPDSDVGAADVDKLKETNGPSQQLSSTNRETIHVVEIGGGGVATNGSRSSGISLSPVPDGENHRPRDPETNTTSSGHKKNTKAQAEMTCELLSEASVEVPISHEDDSMHYEESLQDPNRPNSKRRKTSKPSRRGKGRGR